MSQAYLVLDDGTVFPGVAWGASGATSAPLHVSTVMTGQQGVLTNSDNAGFIMLMTAPHVGNVGMNDETSSSFTVAGVIAREPARRASNWKSTGDFSQALADQGIIGICGVDTRAVTLHLRHLGRSVTAAILSGDALPPHTLQPADDAHTDIIRAAMALLAPEEAN